MDNIDHEIHRLYEENNRYRSFLKSKFILLLISMITIDIILLIYSIKFHSLLLRLLFNIVSGILLTFFFIWFLYNIYRANKR